MSVKTFLTNKDGMSIVGDQRDVLLSVKLREQVWNWCKSQEVNVQGELYGVMGHDLWRIKDPEERALFILRWSNASS